MMDHISTKKNSFCSSECCSSLSPPMQENSLNSTKYARQTLQMEDHSFSKWMLFIFTIFINFNHSHSKENQVFQWNKTQIESQDTQLNLEFHTILAGILCFLAASISSAGGLGGGGLFIPILNIVAGLDLKTASSFSAFMVTGGSVANVIYNLSIRNRKFGGKALIDYDITLLSQPCLLLGVSVGVICNVVFPEWLITILFTVFLAASTFKTFKAGVLHWKTEKDEVEENGFGNYENGLVRDEICGGNEDEKSMEKPLFGGKRDGSLGIPWKKLGILVVIWFSFFALHILLGDKDGQRVIQIETCGIGYWVASSFQIPLAIAFTAWILYQRECSQEEQPTMFFMKEIGGRTRSRPSSKLIFPIAALLAGVLGGVFGIGGGMLISPILLQIGIPPEVTAATCSLMVLFSSSMSAVQYILLGMKQIDDALVFTVGCFVASLIGLGVIQTCIMKYGRASLIIFSISTVMALSTILITSFGALDVWRDYTSGKYMGFKLPC